MPGRVPVWFHVEHGRILPAGTGLFITSLILACLAIEAPAPAQTQGSPSESAASTVPADASTSAGAAHDTATTTASISPAVAIAEVMGSDSPEKRVAAAIRIIEIGSADAFASLTEVLNQKNSEEAKLAICEAIIKTGSKAPAFIEPLLRLAQTSDSVLGTLALKALSHYDEPEVVEQVNGIKTRQEHKLLLEAVRDLDRRLYDLTPENEKSAYLENLLNRPLAVRRVTALEILHRDLSTRKPQDTLLQKVRSLLNDENPAVVRAAVVVLRDLRQKSDAISLRELLKHQNNPEVRETIFDALGYLADADSIVVCAAGLESENEKVAALAALSLGRLSGHNPGPSDELREIAVTALLGRSARPMEDETLRSNVVEAMEKIAAPEFAPVFVKSLDPNAEPLPAVRQSSIRGLASLPSPQHLEAILHAMATDPDVRVREVAAEAVGRIGKTPEVLAPLRDRLEDGSEAVVKAAWTSYLAVIARLTPSERMEAVDGWDTNGAKTLARRVELLNHLARLPDVESHQSASLNEEAGDGQRILNRSHEAGESYRRALEFTPTGGEEDHRKRLAAKMLDAYLSSPDPSGALTEAAKFKMEVLRELAAEKLHAHASGLQGGQRRAFLEQLAREIPDQFGPTWAAKFADLMPEPSTQPATSTAPVG